MTRGFSEAELASMSSRARFRRPEGERNYVEAYPQLNIVQCARAARDDIDGCVWRSNNSTVVGSAAFEWQSSHKLRLRHLFGDRRDPSALVELDVVIDRKGSNEDNQRPLARCPQCLQSRGGLVFRYERWWCRRCHGLGYRSAMVGTPVRRAEKVRRLRTELNELERGFYSPYRLAAKRVQLERAMAALRGSELATAHQGLSLVITANWVKLRGTDIGSWNHAIEGSAFELK